MPVPTIDTTQSVLGFRQYEEFTFQPAATELPLRWTASALPPGVTIETHSALSCTGVASTDVLTAAGNTFVNGDPVYLEEITGGAGLGINIPYFIRDKSGDTFKLATNSGAAAINFTTDISAATIRKVSSGAISGASLSAGVFVVSVRAINGTGTSFAQTFTFGFDAAPGSPDDDAVELFWETTSGAVTLSDPAGGARDASGVDINDSGLFQVKVRDRRLIRVHLRKGGNPLDLTLEELQFTAKEFPEDKVKIVTSSTFEKPAGKNFFNMLVSFGLPENVAAVSGYDESFIAKFEIELQREITFLGSPELITASSANIPVRIVLDLDQD
ncbi:MAG: hypothetical protein ACOVMP_10735 [Chthoniobacterales bacterium]